MARVYPDLRFERYADDALVHCGSEASGSPCEPGGAGLAELLRAVLSLAVRSGAPPLQQGSREMGTAEVHTVPTPGVCGDALAGAHRPPRSRPVRSLATGRAARGWSVGAG